MIKFGSNYKNSSKYSTYNIFYITFCYINKDYFIFFKNKFSIKEK